MTKESKKSSVPEYVTRSGLISLIVAVCFVFVAFVGRLGKSKYTPEFIDDWFGISNYVFTKITERIAQGDNKRIDAGYASAFTFRPGDTETRELLFYAETDQRVELTLKALILNPHGLPVPSRPSQIVRVFVDKTPLQFDEWPFRATKRAVDRQLQYDVEGDIHAIRFNPKFVPAQGELSVECLVMVYRK